ncbi:MAG: hypothetical protein ACYDCO_06055 [Armatimonadota bacterium]
MDEATLAAMIREHAQAAVHYARDVAHRQLDYSEASLQTVELILEKFHCDLPRGFFAKLLKRGPSEREIDDMARMFGSYLGEVIRLNLGGEWQPEHPLFPEIPGMIVGGTMIAPWSKAYKRIVDGPGANLLFYYKILSNQVKQEDSSGTVPTPRD